MSAALDAAELAALLGACVPAGLRWLRVAQREHYLPGSLARFAARWWTSSPLNLAGALVALGAFAASFALPGVAFVSAAVVAAGPHRLAVRGRTSRLVFTRRLRLVAALGAALLALVLGAGAAAGGLAGARIGATAAVLALPLLLDLALAVLAPLEERLARRFVAQASARVGAVGPTIVAITGSYGKTSTKGYVAHLLAGRFCVLASPRSFNNRAGLARTVNELLLPGTDVLVAEMGAYGPGEIAEICTWLSPHVAVITAVGPVHLERFKSLERTLRAKAEITERAEVSVLNVDDERLARLADELGRAGRQVIRCSASSTDADVALVGDSEAMVLALGGEVVGRVPADPAARPAALGNVACALGAAHALGVPAAELLERLSGLPEPPSRLVVSEGASGVRVLDDTFNSNPAGTRLALERLARLGGPGARRVVVTPGMVELGALQDAENAAFGAAAAEVASEVVVVGRTNRRALLEGLARAGRRPGAGVVVVETREEAVAWVRATLRAGDAVLYENDLPDHFP